MKQMVHIKIRKKSTESGQSSSSLENCNVDLYFTGNQGWLKGCVLLPADPVKWWTLILTGNIYVALWERLEKWHILYQKLFSRLQMTGQLHRDFD